MFYRDPETDEVILSDCCNEPARWLDCEECAPTECYLVVCTECGDTVVETDCAEHGGE